MNREYDVIVVGAGPAGSSAARCAARKGARVLLLERRGQPGAGAVCGELVPALLLQECDLPPATRRWRTNNLITHLDGQAPIVTHAPGVMLDRHAFDRALAEAAVAAGAELLLGARALHCGRDHVEVLIAGRREQFRFRVLVAADGPRSVATPAGRKDQLLAFTARVPLPQALHDAHVYFAPWIHGGYAWLFPRGDEANLGIGLRWPLGARLKPRPLLQRAQEKFSEFGLLAGAPLRTLRCGLIPVGGLRTLPADRPLLLAGDAAGLTHPITGAGIGAAVISGEWAGRAAATAAAHRSDKPLREYWRRLRARWGTDLLWATEKRRAWERGWDQIPFAQHLRAHWVVFPEYFRTIPEENRPSPEEDVEPWSRRRITPKA
jgi:geranylgeranyl reductase family protein